METVKVPDSLKGIFEYLEGETADQKLVHLIINDLERRLQGLISRLSRQRRGFSASITLTGGSVIPLAKLSHMKP